MIGADTNILLRLMVPDDPAQNRRALAFLSDSVADAPIFVGLIVVVEMVWVLERKYGYSREHSAAAVRFLLDSPDIVVEEAPLVASVIERVERLGTDIADELIAASNSARGCSRTMTFDRNAAKRIPGMELLK
ncbi:MAG: type II toxin-antitoxin system VapC family toxin [Devosia sp.]|nr:type II toxin-antitoxin system VapC family toxin [Devosia sp.]